MAQVEQMQKEILADAQAEADRILQEVKDRWTKERAEKLALADQEGLAAFQKSKKEAPAIQDRIQAQAESKARNLILAAKQDLVERIFQLAQEKLKALPDAKLQESLDGVLEKNAYPKDSILEVSPGRRLHSHGLAIQEARDIQSGFRILRDGIRDNFDFVEILQYRKQDLVPGLLESLEEVIQ